MAGWRHLCNGHELGGTLGDGEGQKPGMLQSMGSQRVGHDWVTVQQNFTKLVKDQKTKVEFIAFLYYDKITTKWIPRTLKFGCFRFTFLL